MQIQYQYPADKPLDADVVAQFFLEKDSEREESDVTQLKLHKLMYFAQANYLSAVGKPLFDSTIEAFEHGPIIAKIYQKYRKYKKQIIVAAEKRQGNHLGHSRVEIPSFEREYLEDVWEYFYEYSASQLRNMTHNDAPWADNYEKGKAHISIDNEEIKAWYDLGAPLENRVSVNYVSGIDDTLLEALDEPVDDDVLRRWGCLS